MTRNPTFLIVVCVVILVFLLSLAALDAQLSISSYLEPPDYSVVHKQLQVRVCVCVCVCLVLRDVFVCVLCVFVMLSQPDIAPLPKIDNIMPEDPCEGMWIVLTSLLPYLVQHVTWDSFVLGNIRRYVSATPFVGARPVF